MARLVFQPALEGLRGVSVAAVLLFHAAGTWLPGGFLGVSTFFTLSGYLITGLLVAEWEDTGSIRFSAFWARRLRRLLPASLAALVGVAVLGATMADPTQRERLLGDGLSALFYVSNWWLIVTGADYDSLMGSPSVVQHFWSLSVEEQYYFVYPILTYLALRSFSGSKAVFASMLLVATLASWGWMAHLGASDARTARVYFGTDARAGELLAGGVLALALGRNRTIPWPRVRTTVLALGVLGLAITALGWVIGRVESYGLYRGGLPVYACATLAVIAAAVQSGGPVRTLLSWSPLRWLGRISYGTYVYHWPIFLFFDDGPVGIGLTLALAEVSYRWLEEPIRTGRRILGWRRFVAPPLAIGATALALLVAAPARLGVADLASTDAAARARSSGAPPALGRPLRIAVTGDSLARDVGEGLASWAEESGTAVVENLAIRGCGIARGAWLENVGRQRAPCDAWPARARARLAKFHPDVVVALTAGWDLQARKLPEWETPRVIGDPDFDRWLVGQYEEAFRLFRESGARVVWLTTPCRQSPMGATTKTWDPARTRRMNDYVLPTLATGKGEDLSILDLEAAICPDGGFARTVHGIEGFRRDGTHLSEAGKRWVGAWLGEALLGSSRR